MTGHDAGPACQGQVENQLTQITLPDGRLARYRYDGLGLRIEKAVNGTLTRYLYDQEDLVALFTGPSNCQTHAFLHGPGIDQPLAFVKDTNNDCNPFFNAVGFSEPIVSLQTDGLGSTTSLVSETGGFFRSLFLAERTTYDSFGTPTITAPDGTPRATSAFGNPYLFTGREYDPESGIYYYRARYYDPRMGRFLQEDPVGLIGGVNLFRYVSNNPLRFIDPFGLDQKEIVVITQDGVPHSVLEVDAPSSPTGQRYFDFFPADPVSRVEVIKGTNVRGEVRESTTIDPTAKVVGTTIEKKTTAAEDVQTIEEARKIKENPPRYNLYRQNCFSFTAELLD